eukprot:TRINITY_DN625_c1_g2_i2.p1 TRINITY_DN625_c1_g2~~TRINITY_DN625_c1_g2_i2.p1  ORF type:complete len:470 (+),score=155.43 TRINITY_DN625_c1_g2_i2:1-1410(+)
MPQQQQQQFAGPLVGNKTPAVSVPGVDMSALHLRHQHEQQNLILSQQQELQNLQQFQLLQHQSMQPPAAPLVMQQPQMTAPAAPLLMQQPQQAVPHLQTAQPFGAQSAMQLPMQPVFLVQQQEAMQGQLGTPSVAGSAGHQYQEGAGGGRPRERQQQPQRPQRTQQKQGARTKASPTTSGGSSPTPDMLIGEMSASHTSAQQAHKSLTTEERVLINITESVLLDTNANRFLGSLPAVVVQRLVHDRDPEKYAAVIDGMYDRSFHAFIKGHNQFRMFYYDKEVIESRGLTHCSADEGRVTFSDISNVALVQKDFETARWKESLWEEALVCIEGIIRTQPLQMRTLIQHFRDGDTDARFECVLPSNHAFRQLLRRHQDRLVITHDALVKVPEQLTPEEGAEWQRKMSQQAEKQREAQQQHESKKLMQPPPQPHQPVQSDVPQAPRRTKARGRRERRARAKENAAGQHAAEQ